jgi:hypothetical protein
MEYNQAASNNADSTKECFSIDESSRRKNMDQISLPDCRKKMSQISTRTIAAEAVSFLWPVSQENRNGRIRHAGRGKNCSHAQCFVCVYINLQDIEAVIKSSKSSLIKCTVCSSKIPFADLVVDGYFSYLNYIYSDNLGCYIDEDGADRVLSKDQAKEVSTFIISQAGQYSMKLSGTQIYESLSSRLS